MTGRASALLLLALSGLLAACQPLRQPPRVACQAERGIGGTGALVERGIGGTGAPGSRLAERGIGGTGIVGTITGFGSVCVNGLEVALAPGGTVTLDDAPAAPADLRVGQVVALAATPAAGGLTTGAVAAFHVLSGPVWTVAPDHLVVAGQPVRLDPATLGQRDVQPGAWVAVSGLLDLDGTVHATRIDLRTPGPAIVAGRAEARHGVWRLGGLVLRFAARRPPPAGKVVQLRGRLAGRTLFVTAIAPPPGQPLPGGRLLREGFAAVAGGRLRLGDGVAAPLAPGFGPLPPRDAATVIEFVDTPGQGLVATHWHAAPVPGGHAGNAAAPPGGEGEGAGSAGGGEGEGGGSSSGEGGGSGHAGGEASGHGTGHAGGGGSGTGGGGGGGGE